ncbi:hypothetical protein H0H87_002287 [Tephrocybe sp. NHM501043]|nr:hypothetical protein H0H87_002287 [Tephrocybe sp. NHM501043]
MTRLDSASYLHPLFVFRISRRFLSSFSHASYADHQYKSLSLASDRDFEVVPALRSVIVLDDFTLPELDPDEAWEHVYASDADDTTSAPSYAKIAALN